MTQVADSPVRVRTVFLGTGGFGVPALHALAGCPDVELVGLVTAPARPADRRQRLRPSPVAAAAVELESAVILTPERLRSTESIAGVLALRPDLVVLADYGQIVPPALLDLRFGALNLHPSMLPRHRGAAPIPATIVAGDTSTGVVLMRMDAGLDTGPIVAVDEMGLSGDETAPELERELAERGAALLIASLPGWLDGTVPARPQAEADATLTRPLRREDGRLDPRLPAMVLERHVRAFQPWPGSWFDASTGRIVVWSANVAARPPGAASVPGDLLVDDGRLLLATADGALDLRELQPSGGRRMAAADLLRGRPALRGERVEAPPAGPDRGPIERAVG